MFFEYASFTSYLLGNNILNIYSNICTYRLLLVYKLAIKY
jgi:hypothetical protein